jgi:hypothetical protein
MTTVMPWDAFDRLLMIQQKAASIKEIVPFTWD